jgi:hypothetical protein
VLAVLGLAAILGFIHYVFTEIVGLGPALRRLEGGNAWWLAATKLSATAGAGGVPSRSGALRSAGLAPTGGHRGGDILIPAAFGAGVIAVVLLVEVIDTPIERSLARTSRRLCRAEPAVVAARDDCVPGAEVRA